MAGNIIPANASTNAIVAGLIVMTVFKVLLEKLHECHTVRCLVTIETLYSESKMFTFSLPAICQHSPKCEEGTVCY